MGLAGRRSASDWVIDVAAFVFALGLGAAAFATSQHAHSDLGTVVDVVLGLAALAAMWWRRRWPAGIAIAIAVASCLSGLAAGPAIVTAFGATVRCRPKPLAAVWATMVASSLVFTLLYPSRDGVVFELTVGALALAAVFAWGLYARARHQLLLSWRDRAQSLEAEQGLRVAQARDAECRRIASEMHDVLAHRLSLLSLHAGALEYRADASPDEVREAAGVIRDNAHSALEELRTVIGVLREDPDNPTRPPQPTLDQVDELVSDARTAGERVELTVDLAAGAPPASLGRTAYRVVQEGLTNARKHAPGAAVSVRITTTPGPRLHIDIASRGWVGAVSAFAAPPPPGSGTGLIGLRERVALAGGTLDSGPDDSGDFRLHAELPWTVA